MGAPNIGLAIDPLVSGKVRYLALPPVAPGGPVVYQLSFQAKFTNNEAAAVLINTLTVSFPSGSGAQGKVIAIKTLHDDWVTVTDGLSVAKNQSLAPMDFKNTDNIVLSATPPSQITFSIGVQGYSTPKVYTYPLAEFENSAAGGAYQWPGQAHDLARGEYWTGIGANHCCGPQLYAHDLGVECFDPAINDWNPFHPGKSGNKNEHYRVWGKPIYAMADGTIDTHNAYELPDNPNPPTVPKGVETYGNHFIIKHGNDTVLYAHMQRDSRNKALLAGGNGAAVKAGDFLGLVGNSGNAYGAHLHIHSIDKADSTLRPIPWKQKMIANKVSHKRPAGADWQLSKTQGLPTSTALVYPGDAAPADPTEWSDWVSLGGELTSGPAVCSWGPNRLDVFVLATDSSLYHKFWNGSAWSGWEGLGGTLSATPCAVSWGPNRIDVFGRGTDNGLWHKWWDGSHWHDWQNLGGTLLSAPSVCSRKANHLDVFCVATDRTLYHRIWTGSQWTNWESLGGTLTADLAAESWGLNRIDVFGCGTDEKLYHKWWNGTAWSAWEFRDKKLKFGPSVASRKANHLDVFVAASDGTLQHTMWTGSAWWHWESLGGMLTASPAAVSWSANRLDVFARGTDNALYHAYWAG